MADDNNNRHEFRVPAGASDPGSSALIRQWEEEARIEAGLHNGDSYDKYKYRQNKYFNHNRRATRATRALQPIAPFKPWS